MKILFRGPCDIKALCAYIKNNKDIIVESAIKGEHMEIVWQTSYSLFLDKDASKKYKNHKFFELFHFFPPKN